MLPHVAEEPEEQHDPAQKPEQEHAHAIECIQWS